MRDMEDAVRFGAGQSHAPVWGAHLRADGSWDVAIWAPSAPEIAVDLQDGERVALVKGADGVHRGILRASEGARYALVCGGVRFADPAALQMDGGVEGWSVLRDPRGFRRGHSDWAGRPFDTAVFLELHVGSFTEEGTFAAAAARLKDLAAVGITAIELMPLGQFPGEYGWGYDSALPFAPHHAYGSPEDLAALVDTAHGLSMMVFLDVVFNHFGPTGSPLPILCPEFFLDEENDWGRKIDFSRPEVRAYFTACAKSWIVHYGLDGLRLDAVQSMEDDSDPPIAEEIAREVRNLNPGWAVHLVGEDSSNLVRLYDPDAGLYDAKWNDDYHHALHVLLTGESFGYYADFTADPLDDLCTALRDGQARQGQVRSDGSVAKGEPSGHLPYSAFVAFNQNHDQIGNRPRGDRLVDLIGDRRAEVAHAFLLTSPFIPLLFMGEESGSRCPFPWFSNVSGAAADGLLGGRNTQLRAAPWRTGRDAGPVCRRDLPADEAGCR